MCRVPYADLWVDGRKAALPAAQLTTRRVFKDPAPCQQRHCGILTRHWGPVWGSDATRGDLSPSGAENWWHSPTNWNASISNWRESAPMQIDRVVISFNYTNCNVARSREPPMTANNRRSTSNSDWMTWNDDAGRVTSERCRWRHHVMATRQPINNCRLPSN